MKKVSKVPVYPCYCITVDDDQTDFDQSKAGILTRIKKNIRNGYIYFLISYPCHIAPMPCSVVPLEFSSSFLIFNYKLMFKQDHK